jgi:MOSC domain-containing protein YiiM
VFLGREYSRVSQKRNPGWSRVYTRVLVEGAVRTGDPIQVLTERAAAEVGAAAS